MPCLTTNVKRMNPSVTELERFLKTKPASEELIKGIEKMETLNNISFIPSSVKSFVPLVTERCKCLPQHLCNLMKRVIHVERYLKNIPFREWVGRIEALEALKGITSPTVTVLTVGDILQIKGNLVDRVCSTREHISFLERVLSVLNLCALIGRVRNLTSNGRVHDGDGPCFVGSITTGDLIGEILDADGTFSGTDIPSGGNLDNGDFFFS